MNSDNWICDIYKRIDETRQITGVMFAKLSEEIIWCYRLGYVTSDECIALKEYLENATHEKEVTFERYKEVRSAQIRYEQDLMRQHEEEKEFLRKLFKTGMKYEKGKYVIIS